MEEYCMCFLGAQRGSLPLFPLRLCGLSEHSERAREANECKPATGMAILTFV